MTRMERHVGLALFVTFLLVAAACGDSGTTTTTAPATPANNYRAGCTGNNYRAGC